MKRSEHSARTSSISILWLSTLALIILEAEGYSVWVSGVPGSFHHGDTLDIVFAHEISSDYILTITPVNFPHQRYTCTIPASFRAFNKRNKYNITGKTPNEKRFHMVEMPTDIFQVSIHIRGVYINKRGTSTNLTLGQAKVDPALLKSTTVEIRQAVRRRGRCFV
ncbi:hypothetical protein PoB_001599800 [Plakobranchus ocellatus]|uniref:Uncharacterized protein n=1 Tax=Plakobranchus ocellatus TaxID=259542 RepID=A0AAV3Z421_9GAST|nr:hypothetical protein PoB_001599800 [Plakobranchus ocellatus]